MKKCPKCKSNLKINSCVLIFLTDTCKCHTCQSVLHFGLKNTVFYSTIIGSAIGAYLITKFPDINYLSIIMVSFVTSYASIGLFNFFKSDIKIQVDSPECKDSSSK